MQQIVTRATSGNNGLGINLDALYSGGGTQVAPPIDNSGEEKKRRGRPKKTESAPIATTPSERELSMLETNTPYINTYQETQEQLKATVNGIDILTSQIAQDLEAVRNSRALKNKYSYICDLTSAAGSLVGNRIAAIREINNTITNAHRLDISRLEKTKAMMQETDDDKAIMDMYRAYVNTPVGTIPNMPSMVVPTSSLNSPVGTVPINTPTTISQEDAGYDAFINGNSPEMTAIMFEKNPNLQTVVVYNQTDQSKWFDIIDVTTGQSLPNIPRPPEKLLENMHIDIMNGTAKNIQTDQIYPLVLVGNRKLDEY